MLMFAECHQVHTTQRNRIGGAMLSTVSIGCGESAARNARQNSPWTQWSSLIRCHGRGRHRWPLLIHFDDPDGSTGFRKHGDKDKTHFPLAVGRFKLHFWSAFRADKSDFATPVGTGGAH